jgi:hypothetical protein
MKQQKGFSAEVKQEVMDAYYGFCWLCQNKATEVHHRLSNSISHKAMFPLFLNSIFNAAALDRDCHINGKHVLDIPNKLAMAYEVYLALFATEWYNKGKEDCYEQISKGKHVKTGKVSVYELRERKILP